MSIGFLNPLLIEDAVRRALDEDLGRAGDITTQATISASHSATLVITSREDGVIAGLPVAERAFHAIAHGVRFTPRIGDGTAIQKGTIIAEVEGSARAILSAERVALNFLGRMSGIATLTRHFVEAVADTEAKIVCTRKTTPGLRAFEKYAVRCGGGSNHRYGLDDAMLIKDNHIAVAGSITAALQAAKAAAGHLVKVEIEVDTLAQLHEVLAEGADVVLLDNMDNATLKQAVDLVEGAMLTEASGGVTLATVAAIAATGVDMISVGALTHSPRVLDLGLDIKIR
jgi:nicotinate-nucleotide pyrophosphorylase (carboxylating)